MRILQQVTNRTKAAAIALLGKATESVASLGKGMVEMGMAFGLNRLFRVSYERNQVHRDMHRMDSDDEIACFAFSTIASRAVGMEDPTLDSFEVTVQAAETTDDEVPDTTTTEAQVEINRLIKRLDLRQESWQIVRAFVKWGNEFREVIIGPDGSDIVGFAQRPEHTMWPNTDPNGNRVPGYKQIPEHTPTSGASINFAEWEVIHFAFGEKDGYLGTPLLKCARKNWKRLNIAEDSTAVARLIRAFMKIIHKVPVSPDWGPEEQRNAIQLYKDQMTKMPLFDQGTGTMDQTDWPTTVQTDLYIADDGSKRGGVEMLDPENAQLQNISDIRYFLDRFITGTTIPKRYFPFEGSVPKLSEGGGQAEDKNFACTLMFCQMVLKAGYAKLFDRQLILKGLDPSRFRYVMRMGDINTTDQLRVAQTQAALAGAMERLLGRYPELREHVDVILQEYTRMSDASLSKLSKVKIEKELPADTAPAANRPKTQLPGMGNKEARSQL